MVSYYRLGVEEILRRLNTSEGGLTEEEAQGRLRQYGPNKLAEEKKTSKVAIFLHQFTSPLIYIILIAAVITAFYKDFVDAAVIMVAVVLNAIIGYVQENKAEESVRALKRLVVPRGRVLRGGREREIESEQLVPGDIVLLASGAKVPADLRLFQVTELRIEEAMITGESLPSDKIADPIGEEYLTPGDQRNMAFMGTVVVAGRAKGLVVATGGGTLLGEIASEVKEVSVAQAPLQEKIVKFARLIAIFALCGTAVISAVGLLIGVQAREMFKIAVAAMVATVPEGLPVVATIVLAVGVSRMAKRNAIVRRLPAVETLGSATVICTDKTGTLTQNEMTVRVIYDGEETYEATGTGYDPRGEIKQGGQPIDPAELQKLRMALRIGMLCNESSLYEEDGQIKVNGDPTEAALIVSAKKGGLVYEQERDSYPQLGMIPFESDRGYMATLHRSKGARVVFVKGAPERILDLCTECELKKAIETKAILSKAHELGEHGLRVIALAYKEVSPQIQQLSPQVVEGDLVLAGLQGIMDPPGPRPLPP